MAPLTLVIVGGNAAGMKAASRARRLNPDCRIMVFEQKAYVSYGACGLPYFTSGVVKERQDLVVRSPQYFKSVGNIDVHTGHKVIRLNPSDRTITVKNLQTEKEQTVFFDNLILTTGVTPVIPPLPNINLHRIFTVKTLEDGEAIRQCIRGEGCKEAVIVGAGLIGLEMAENLHRAGLKVSVVELLPQVLPPFSPEIAFSVEKHLREKGVEVFPGERVKGFEGDEKQGVKRVVTEQRELKADLVILSIGVRPNIELAKVANITLGPTGAIQVNERMETSMSSIFAAGDCAETKSLLTGKPVWVPLGSIANKQGRVAGENAAGGIATFRGVLPSIITKVFDLTIAKTGLNEQEAIKAGFAVERSIVLPFDKAHYYPGAKPLLLKMIADRMTRRILGGEILGEAGVDKRADALAAAIYNDVTCEDLSQLDVAYSPPYSPAMDALITGANVLLNKFSGIYTAISADELKQKIDRGGPFLLLDVRTAEEYQAGHIPGALHIPLDKLRERSLELKGKATGALVVYCGQSLRSYQASRILKELGLGEAINLEGGIRMWRWEKEKA
ncbi:MAG TPA: FAD-dependent oxidoreductase [Thermodesulfobacteriota bacterium]|nr:FAD-dependent oxidoreductase [Thermodesulfobacteriota bacterium]